MSAPAGLTARPAVVGPSRPFTNNPLPRVMKNASQAALPLNRPVPLASRTNNPLPRGDVAPAGLTARPAVSVATLQCLTSQPVTPG